MRLAEGGADKRNTCPHVAYWTDMHQFKGSGACDVKTHVFLVNTMDSLHVKYLHIFTGISVLCERQV